MKRALVLVAALTAGLLVGLLAPATSGAAVPCRDRIFNDWYHDGRVASSYPTSCYRDALRHIPTDAKIYSSLATDIRSAMLASLRRQQGKPVPKQVGHGLRIVSHGGVDGELVSIGDTKVPRSAAEPPATGSPGTTPAATASGEPAASASSGTPLPILVLGGLALALAGAGAVGTGVRYVRGRK